MSIVKLYAGNVSKIQNKDIENGALYFSLDQNGIFLDLNDERFKITEDHKNIWHDIKRKTTVSELKWDGGHRIYYGSYNTEIDFTTDAYNNYSIAYNIDPSCTIPSSRTYNVIQLQDFKLANGNYLTEESIKIIRAMMWFGYGGPGFDPSLFPTIWTDGSSFTEEHYYVSTMLMVAYAVTQNPSTTYYASGYAFVAWCAENVLGVDNFGREKGTNVTYKQICEKIDEVPEDYQVYILDCGDWDYTGWIIGQDYYDLSPAAVSSLKWF